MEIATISREAGCFVGETLVKTKEGYKEIRDIEIGEMVWSFDEENDKKSWKKVYEIFTFDDKKIIEILLSDDTSIRCTEDHLFFVDGDWVEAKELEYIDDLEIIKIKKLKQTCTVYDISVENNNTFFVTENNILVHTSSK
ncbi:MAG: Hint domain-containing protein [Flavobacterium sp.]|nr:Hint domain-containing protein [Flavobacterium sp.]